MAFSSFNEALAMAGHGPYVWAAYLLTAAVLAVLVATPMRRARQSQEQIQAELRRISAAATTPIQEGNHASHS